MLHCTNSMVYLFRRRSATGVNGRVAEMVEEGTDCKPGCSYQQEDAEPPHHTLLFVENISAQELILSASRAWWYWCHCRR
jgi:hypothetical protein